MIKVADNVEPVALCSTSDKLERGRRGLFIVVEGIDRAGKSTQCQRLVEYLNEGRSEKTTSAYRFPKRETAVTGPILNQILTTTGEVTLRSLHLIFSANRWECMNEIKQLLLAGRNVVCDRYAFSGLVYSTSQGLPHGWCVAADQGLLRPDLVLLLDLPISVSSSRGGFGGERFEKMDLQERVRAGFAKLTEEYGHSDSKMNWHVIDATKDMDSVFNEMVGHVNRALKNPALSLYDDLFL